MRSYLPLRQKQFLRKPKVQWSEGCCPTTSCIFLLDQIFRGSVGRLALDHDIRRLHTYFYIFPIQQRLEIANALVNLIVERWVRYQSSLSQRGAPEN